MELLSPAGNRDALQAAIACGADACYLGYTSFGARSYAGNFDDDGLKEAVGYAHERGKKIYVTVNTLVKQPEMDDVCDVLELLCRCGADAAIVQDFGVARIARECFPELTLHASTQMTIHNAQGARMMQKHGFDRVVPARECSLSELKRIADTGVEVEAFAHGALCVAISGQCLFSSMIGGRSGNRGKCAQPCRLPYTLEDGTNGYLLSTKDLMLIEHIPQLRDAGITSFKLEGRMKRPEYVGVITRAYREAVDAAKDRIPYRPDEKTLAALRQVFNRGGFTDGYVMDKSDAALMSWERPNHWGIYMGKVSSVHGQLAKVSLEESLHDGDGLQIRGKNETDLTYSGNEAFSGSIATVRTSANMVKAGDSVYRLTDALQMKEIREYVAKERVQIPLHAVLTVNPGDLPELKLFDEDGHEACAQGETPVQEAKQRALDYDTAIKQLSKTGGTPYVLSSLQLKGEGAFMTAGALNALRRSALDEMRAARTAVKPYKSRREQTDCSLGFGHEQLLIVQGEKLEHAQELLECGADLFYWYPQNYTKASLERTLLNCPEAKPVLVLPAVTYTQELETLYGFVCANSRRLSGVQVSNIGQLDYDWPVPVVGGQGLNVLKRSAAQFLTASGIKRLTASCELSLGELKSLVSEGGSFEVEVYGRTQLMLLSHCPRRTKAGALCQDSACHACSDENGCTDIYTDRKGYRFPAYRLKMDHGCLVRLYNSVPTDMIRSAKKLRQTSCSIRLAFTDEPFMHQKELVRSYRAVLDGKEPLHAPKEGATSGHLMRGVE